MEKFDPSTQAGSVIETVTLGLRKSVRLHLTRIGYRRHPPSLGGPAEWYTTKHRLARITAFNRATIYFRVK